ncbi:uncharacterized protein TRIADDRAFT_59908 [Trichoplax adhaerens]|uniref:Fe2OG dioxygenase domain-containing protein n=1 Tax=Trichoplax adhaerens TaxID=10228 RepID=B3S6S2_TRIAD|nr:hypothetical protein TRIADDRAFT_59908 [Trichoplax adhaerens]EDV21671.1 hypothetical protein TRIADDRAFT_59908 [Trichoplax adhaerens]|eukprot:XP_002115819.1 hypothetical protein TRIADDRAFT_59908 [Trichoplax adhaerens]
MDNYYRMSDPKDEFIVKNIQISMLSRKKKGSKTRTVLKTLKVMDNASLVNQQATARYQKIRELCIGNENLPAKSSGHHLKCYYFYPSSKTRFMPYAIEEMSRDPLIILYHNLTSNAEMESLKALAAKQLQPAGVYHTTSADNRNLEGYTRIAKMAFILDEESAVASAITQRLQDVTGLNMNFSEPLQVINYGIAGQYTPHYDTFPAKSGDRSHPSHDRLATAILYLSDVERGGATVFTNINVRVLPRKGNVIIWYNYLPDGNLHPGTLHAGCPVLVGSKWIANKWIQSKGQMLQSPRNGG